jgi:hypothetical protein
MNKYSFSFTDCTNETHTSTFENTDSDRWVSMLEDFVNFLEASGFHGVRARIRGATPHVWAAHLDDEWSGKFFDSEEGNTYSEED